MPRASEVKVAHFMARLALGALACALCACTSLQVVERPSPDAVARDYAPRDRVTVVLHGGGQIDILVKQVTPMLLVGTDPSGRLHEIPVEQIEQIQTRRFSFWKTAGLALLAFTAWAANEIDRNGVIN